MKILLATVSKLGYSGERKSKVKDAVSHREIWIEIKYKDEVTVWQSI